MVQVVAEHDQLSPRFPCRGDYRHGLRTGEMLTVLTVSRTETGPLTRFTRLQDMVKTGRPFFSSARKSSNNSVTHASFAPK